MWVPLQSCHIPPPPLSLSLITQLVNVDGPAHLEPGLLEVSTFLKVL